VSTVTGQRVSTVQLATTVSQLLPGSNPVLMDCMLTWRVWRCVNRVQQDSLVRIKLHLL